MNKKILGLRRELWSLLGMLVGIGSMYASWAIGFDLVNTIANFWTRPEFKAEFTFPAPFFVHTWTGETYTGVSDGALVALIAGLLIYSIGLYKIAHHKE